MVGVDVGSSSSANGREAILVPAFFCEEYQQTLPHDSEVPAYIARGSNGSHIRTASPAGDAYLRVDEVLAA